MVIRIWLFIFFLIAASSANAASHHLFIAEKSFSDVTKSIEIYLSTKNYSIKETNDKVFEIYFDLPELSYLKKNGYIRYKAVQYHSKKKNKKKYRENIEYSPDGNRTYTFPVKHYNSVKTFEEKHPLLHLIKRKERQHFIDRLKQNGVKYPMRLKEILQVSKLVHTFELYSDTHTAGSIYISKVRASAFGNDTKFIMLEIDTQNSQRVMDDLHDLLGIRDKNNTHNEYVIAYEEMKKHVGLFYWIVRYPYLINLLYGAGFGLIGLMIIFFMFGKRLKGASPSMPSI